MSKYILSCCGSNKKCPPKLVYIVRLIRQYLAHRMPKVDKESKSAWCLMGRDGSSF